MRTQSSLFRLTATTAIVAVALGPLLPQTGFAQSLPPLPSASAPSTPEAQTTADPPTRVGRLSRVAGQVSFHGPGADHWDTASLNFPVTSGDSFWTQPGGSADLGVTNNRLTMDQSTEFDIATLDDHSLTGTVAQGQIYLRLLALAPGETYTIVTPRGVAAITAPGRYEISAGDTENPTRITVLEGSAQLSGSNLNLQVASNQTVLITGTDPFLTQVVPVQRDAFLTAQLARERPAVASGGVTAPALVAQMTGGEDLAQYGAWQDAPQYGQVWYPQVAAGYVPYRNGHWAYVAPWGWTWIDAAPWGFAPFHYGRWVQIGGRWGWAPGGGVSVYGAPGYIAPVYAPALVAFFGIGAAIGVGIGLAGGFGGNVGWCPLGWQEPYHPWYRTSPGYVRNVNSSYVRNVTNISTINNNNVTINNYANRGAATVVPASAMARSQPVGQFARPVQAAQFAQARPVIGQQPVAPTTATAGVTPRVAQEMHLQVPPPGAGPATRPAAPGPALHAQVGSAPNAPNERPALQSNARPAAPGVAPQAAHEPVAPAIGAPNAAATPHAPGPAIEPRTSAVAPATPPALRAPAEAARTAPAAAPRAPGAVAGTPAAPAPQAQLREAPHPAAPAAAAHPQVAQSHPQVAQPHPQVAQPHPQVAEPHPQVAQPRPQVAQPQPQPRPQVAQPRPQPQSHPQVAQPHPQPAPHAPERRQQGQAGGGGHGPHRA